jgi:hypothetical protein
MLNGVIYQITGIDYMGDSVKSYTLNNGSKEGAVTPERLEELLLKKQEIQYVQKAPVIVEERELKKPKYRTI